MNNREAYFQRIQKEEVEALRAYSHFLSVFYKNLHKEELLAHYSEQEQIGIRKLQKIRRVMESMAIAPLTGERDLLVTHAESCLKKISHSLDRMKGALHDEISSLNKKNGRMDLRYNRYDIRTAKPGMIDITT